MIYVVDFGLTAKVVSNYIDNGALSPAPHIHASPEDVQSSGIYMYVRDKSETLRKVSVSRMQGRTCYYRSVR